MRFTQVLFCLVGAAVAAPHSGMIDTAELRDVGTIHTEANYQGVSQFILENRKDLQCYPINVGMNDKAQGMHIGAVQICQNVHCRFYTGDKCDGSEGDDWCAEASGPGDIPDLKTPAGNLFKSYACTEGGVGSFARPANIILETVPHDASAGM